MIKSIIENEQVGTISRRQQLFLKYIVLVLINLVVINLFNEHWDFVYIELFSISLLTAALLQILLQITVAIEHKVANFFKQKTGLTFKILRGISTWGILFASKLIILQAINLAFGESVSFSGPVHGLVAFIIVIITMIIVEQLVFRIYWSLAENSDDRAV